ncbi:MAG: hypothetical protein GEU71_10990 [Actinobacteria bacterium]|nr:hypothetical protein [Actinomycetota bacterium]
MFSRATKVMLALMLAVGSSVFVSGSASAAVDLVIKAKPGDQWSPAHPIVRRGGDGKVVVKWKNPRNRVHDIKSTNEGKNWTLKRKTLRKGDAARKTFKKNGNYYFRCTLHSTKSGGGFVGMVGIVHVRN